MLYTPAFTSPFKGVFFPVIELAFSPDLIGNFHPLLVHLPIGIFILGFGLELFSKLKKQVIPPYISAFILIAASVFAVLSIVSGLVLGNGGGYEEAALNLHRNMGIAFAVGTIILYGVFRLKTAWAKKAYLPLFALLVVLLSVTGHYGGNITHGAGFLFDNAPTITTNIAVQDITEAQVYEELVVPLLEAKCIGCHNNTKTKGGLLMTSKEMLLKGGEHGSIFPNSKDSLGSLLHRIHLDPSDKLHMPPKAKVQLTRQEIDLLDWWIKNDYCFDCRVASLPTDAYTKEFLEAFVKEDSPINEWAALYEPVPEKWLGELQALGMSAYPIAAKNPLLIVNAKGRKDLKKSDFKFLKKYASQIVELNLSHSNMNDTLAAYLTAFEHLVKLQMPQTQISDASLDYLITLKHLASLNAFNTNLSSLALEKLSKLEGLKKVYLIDTQIAVERLALFNEQNEQIKMEYVSPETFAQTSLDPPKIVSETDFFKTSIEVSLAYVFEDADLYYTLDGSVPDTLSIPYKAPFTLRESSQVRAITHMKGWGMSEVAQADFKKSALDYKQVSLLATPNEKYAAQGGNSLVDLKRGSTNFVDGMWLGFEGVHTGADITLERTEKIKSISIGALSAPASWIFFPAAVEIYSATNGKDYTLIAKKSFAPIDPTNDISKKFFDISIPETQTQHLKVVIKSPLKNPSWHPNPGGNSWVFIDEIILD